MIILVGGSSHVGKTLVSQKLLEKYKYQCISMDHLKMGFIRTNRTELTVEDDFEMRYFLWPYVAEVIKTAIENEQNLIIEGCYIPREWKESFTEEHMSKICCIFIVMSESYIREHFEDIVKYNSVIEHRILDEPDMERLIKCSKNFEEDCIMSETPYIEIDEKYDLEEILMIIDEMVNNIKQRRNLPLGIEKKR